MPLNHDYARDLSKRLSEGLTELCAKVANEANPDEMSILRSRPAREKFMTKLSGVMNKDNWNENDLLEIAGLCIALYLHSYARNTRHE